MIRTAIPRDIPRILELLTQVNMVHHIGRPDLFNGPATKYTHEELLALFSDARAHIFVYTDDTDTVQGYAFCFLQQHVGDNILTDIKTLYIDDLCVEEAMRGQRIGKALFEHAKSHAAALGCHNLTLNVWAFNASAVKFYEALGMKPQKFGMETIL